MILVAGATGMLGSMITRRLLEEGREVRVLLRPKTDDRALREAGAEVVFGDLKDRASLNRAMGGVEIVITTANSAARGGDDNVQTVEIDGNRNLIDAARRPGVRQFIFVSALGSSLDHPVPFMRGKALAEEHLRESGIPYTILAPSVFMEMWVGMIVGGPLQCGQPVTLVGEGRRRHSFVSIEDVAAFAVAATDNPAAINQYVPIGGPVGVSWSEIVEQAGRVLGRALPVRHIQPGQPLPGLPDAVAHLLGAQDSFDSVLEMTETARTYGVTLTPLDAYLRRAFSGAAIAPDESPDALAAAAEREASDGSSAVP